MRRINRFTIPHGVRRRFFEAAVVLLALLVSNQLAWLASVNILGRLPLRVHGIFLLPSVRSAANERDVRSHEGRHDSQIRIDTNDLLFLFTIFAAPLQGVHIRLNSAKSGDMHTDGAGRLDGQVLLRRGSNDLTVRTFGSYRYFEDEVEVVLYPSKLLPFKLLGVVPTGQDTFRLTGDGEPDSMVHLDLSPDRLTTASFTEVYWDGRLGLFTVPYHLPLGAAGAVNAWLDLRCPSGRPNGRVLFALPPAGSQARCPCS